MRGHRKQSEAAQRHAERRQREDEAPRLRDQVPALVDLSLEIEECSDAIATDQRKHVRRIVVDHAPALFLIPCGEPRCTSSGHDVTAEVMRALFDHKAAFGGTDRCSGTVGSSMCGRMMSHQAHATYRS